MNIFFRTSVKISTISMLLAFTCNSTVYADNVIAPNITVGVDSFNNEQFLQQASAMATKQLLAANVAVEQGSAKVKTLGRTMLLKLAEVNEEIRNLAKLKQVALPLSVPEGGQRPDGRVDAAPENLKDTTRHRYGVGEAGNTGQSKTATGKVGDGDINQSIDKLKKLKGSAFDQAYMNMISTDQQNALSLFTQASNSSDAAVRKFAKKYLQVLKKPTSKLYQ